MLKRLVPVHGEGTVPCGLCWAVLRESTGCSSAIVTHAAAWRARQDPFSIGHSEWQNSIGL